MKKDLFFVGLFMLVFAVLAMFIAPWNLLAKRKENRDEDATHQIIGENGKPGKIEVAEEDATSSLGKKPEEEEQHGESKGETVAGDDKTEENRGSEKGEPGDGEPENGEAKTEKSESGETVAGSSENGTGGTEPGEVGNGEPGNEGAENTEKGDAGEEQETARKPIEFETVGYEYFEDALFIGDSRTVGLMEYGGIEGATFFANAGMSVFKLEKKKVDVPSKGKVSFDEILEEKQYGKVYLMLGINELGYSFESVQEQYQKIVDKIKLSQEGAVIYLCANMHVTEEQSDKDEIYNNANVNMINEMISGLADNERVFFIDVNEKFDDENGSLSTEYSSDAFHVYGRYYKVWVDWLCTKAVSFSL